MSGACVNCSRFGLLHRRGWLQNDEGGPELRLKPTQSRRSHTLAPCFVYERGSYVRPPDRGVLPPLLSARLLFLFSRSIFPRLYSIPSNSCLALWRFLLTTCE